MSDGLVTFDDITQRNMDLSNYMEQALIVDDDGVSDQTLCGNFNGHGEAYRMYYPTEPFNHIGRIAITRNDGREFDILELRAGHGFANGTGLHVWATAYLDGDVAAQMDIDTTCGTLVGFQGQFDTLRIAAYRTSEIRDRHSEDQTNAIALDDVEYGRGSGEQYTLNVGGECPGRVTVGWTGADANAQQGLVIGQNTGSTTIPPNQPCSGTVLGVQGQVQLIDPPGLFTTGGGSGQISGTAGSGVCGRYLQLVHGGTCITSNVERLQ
jgi:hypothetical protein